MTHSIRGFHRSANEGVSRSSTVRISARVESGNVALDSESQGGVLVK